jgi:hypothetical protein
VTAHVVYQSGEWKKAGMDGMTCDRHSSARAQAKVTLPSGGVLYCCGHCSHTLDFGGDYLIEYEMVTVS